MIVGTAKNGRTLRWAAATLAAAVSSGAALLAYAAAVEPNWIEVRAVPLTLPRLGPAFHGYRLVQISDIHAGKWMSDLRLERIVDRVNAEQPDLIAITGDFVTRVYRGAPRDIGPVLRRLQAADGVVAVLGNHDYWGRRGPGLIRRLIHDTGLIDLNNKVHRLERGGDMLYLAGVDTALYREARLDEVLRLLPGEGPAILLAHEPDFADQSAATRRFDLQLSGHSHGGQVRLPGLPPPRLPPLAHKYHTGLYQVGTMLQYTNRGLGMVGLPLRFCARPEITVFTLQAPGVGQHG
jgi:predicted MPP superfamily phosphohydrolase